MDSITLDKLEKILIRYNFIEQKLSESDILGDSGAFLDLSKEYSSLKNIVLRFIKYNQICKDIINIQSLLIDDDYDMRRMAIVEARLLEEKKLILESEINDFFTPKNENINNIFIEIRAATGGDESAIFAEDLFKMYFNYFLHKDWRVEVMSFSYGNCGGYKEIILRVLGIGVFENMKNESGVHRVQRVPKTETRGRIHTSTCSIAILPELELVDDVVIEPSELRIDTYRASGAGGQHVNVTDSAVRVTHKPSGIVAECQDERSQHKNKQKALSLLKSRLLIFEKNKQKYEIDDYRKRLVGTGIRSEKIRTYNYNSNRITDHRNNFTVHKLSDIMSGKLWLLLDQLK